MGSSRGSILMTAQQEEQRLDRNILISRRYGDNPPYLVPSSLRDDRMSYNILTPRLYLAAAWGRRMEIDTYAAYLERFEKIRGEERIQVVSTWHSYREPETWLPEPEAAENNLYDLRRTTIMVVFTDVPTSKGGYMVEFGYALGLHLPVLIVGPYPNIFFHQTIPNLFQMPAPARRKTPAFDPRMIDSPLLEEPYFQDIELYHPAFFNKLFRTLEMICTSEKIND